MPLSDPHITRYELPHGSHVRAVRVCHEVVSVEKYTITCYSSFTSGNSERNLEIEGFKMPRLNNENRARALGMLECGNSQNDVARRFGVSISTIVQRVNTTGPRSGAPRVTSVRQDVFLPSTSPA